MKKGIIYTAIGQKYINEAKLSAKSVKRFCPEINITLFTDTPQDARFNIFDNIVEIENSNSSKNQIRIDKLSAYLKTPYDYTLYLDTDTYILDDISEIFNILNRFDLAICHGHNRVGRYRKALNAKASLPEIPYAFAEVNSGVFLYKNDDKLNKFLQDLITLYKQKQYFSDQTSLRELLWKSDLRFYILPREYNFNSIEDLKRWATWGFSTARPKIFHYTVPKLKNQNLNIEKMVQPFLERLAKSEPHSLIERLRWRLTMMLLSDY